ncbi:MAG: histidine kinase [Verrucomicrobia bacterium]|nr:histidine kinase [Verrucomicrobiota bacterium]
MTPSFFRSRLRNSAGVNPVGWRNMALNGTRSREPANFATLPTDSAMLPKMELSLCRAVLMVENSCMCRQFMRVLTGGRHLMQDAGRNGTPNASRLIALVACLPLQAGIAFEVMPDADPPSVPVAANAPVPTAKAPLIIGSDAVEPYVRELGSWIWAGKTFDGQSCQLWRTIEIPPQAKVAKAHLVMTADNEFTLFLDGHALGRAGEWRELFIFDLTTFLHPGRHVLAIQAFNTFMAAGVVLGLRVDLEDGRIIGVKSDESWRIAPEGAKGWEQRLVAPADWPAATVVAPLGSGPWSQQYEVAYFMPIRKPTEVFFWQTGWFQILLLVVCGAAIMVSLRFKVRLARNKKDQLLLRRERTRIAREIHDDIGARMTQLVLHGEVAQGGLPANSEAQVRLNQLCEDARGLLSSMDEILWALNPRRDTVHDFSAHVCKYAEEFLAPTRIHCWFEVDPHMSVTDLDLPVRRSLFLAVKETLNNAVKHSGASELRLRIHRHGHRLLVGVEDNGKGFDLSEVGAERHGLTNMMLRMSELGGVCRVNTKPGSGCRVEFGIPLTPTRQGLPAWIRRARKPPALPSETVDTPTGPRSPHHETNQC